VAIIDDTENGKVCTKPCANCNFRNTFSHHAFVGRARYSAGASHYLEAIACEGARDAAVT
jgi:hypothetical protein